MNGRISLDQAVDLLLRAARPAEPLALPLAQALGLASATDIRADRNVPPQARSALDGLALRAEDSAAASAQAPLRLPVSGSLRPSTEAKQGLEPGQGWRVLTGAPLPAGADAVVPDEEIEFLGDAALLRAPVAPGRGVRAPLGSVCQLLPTEGPNTDPSPPRCFHFRRSGPRRTTIPRSAGCSPWQRRRLPRL